MHMHEIGIAERCQDRGRERIAGRAAERDAPDRDRAEGIFSGEDDVRPSELPVERQHTRVDAGLDLGAGEIGDEVLQPAAVRMELAHHMEDAKRPLIDRDRHGFGPFPGMVQEDALSWPRTGFSAATCGRSPLPSGCAVKM